MSSKEWKKYCFNVILAELFIMPVVCSVLLIPLSEIFYPLLNFWPLPIGLVSALGGWRMAKRKLPEEFFRRYLPVYTPLIYLLLMWAIALVYTGGNIAGSGFEIFTSSHFQYMLAYFFLAFGRNNWSMLYFGICIYLCFIGAFMLTAERGAHKTFKWGKMIVIFNIVLILTVVICLQAYQRNKTVLSGYYAGVTVKGEVDTYDYMPWNKENALVRLDKTPSFQIREDYPILDGATAVLPLYAAMAQELYAAQNNELKKYVQCSKTPEAYERLINGDIDIFFGAQPSKGQVKAAEEKGITLELIPIGREAFVFFVNSNNPVSGLTQDEIVAIYTKNITNWEQLNGSDTKIIPFQRPENSGSQTIMQDIVMNGKHLPEPLKEEFVVGMGGIIDEVASYRNYDGAVGYSFRFFTTDLKGEQGIKLLAIDGAEPTVENIKAGIYPYTVEIYAVIGETKNENTRDLLDWVLSEEGQQLIEKVGYVGIN